MDERDIDWSIISLKRTPERLAEFRRLHVHEPVTFDVFDAVDGKTLDRAELTKTGLLADDAGIWSSGGIGSALSHRELWLRALRSGRPGAIFEDDIALRGDFKLRVIDALRILPKDWDVLMLGYNTDSILDLSLAPGLDLRASFSPPIPSKGDCASFVAFEGPPVAGLKLNNAFGICSYVVSRKGARSLLDACFPMRPSNVYIPALGFAVTATTIDGMANAIFKDIQAYACVPPLVLPINDKATSTIGR